MQKHSPARLGQIELEPDPIGEGAMGRVWRGLHLPTGREVAVKVATSAADRTDDARAAFAREARMVAALRHPAIVQILDYGAVGVQESHPALQEGCPYLVMELADAGTLAKHARDFHTWDQVQEVLLVLLNALAHAHARSVVHRDIKPPNVLRRADGSWCLADFGIARSQLDPSRGRGLASGTPRYMAPEQIAGRNRLVGAWSDLYALGSTAWWLVIGKKLFADVSGKELLRKHMGQRPGPFAPRLSVPEGLEAWLQRMLAKSPYDRFRCAADAAVALKKCSEGRVRAHGGNAPQEAGYARTFTGSPDESTWEAGPESSEQCERARPPPVPSHRAPIPPDWRPASQTPSLPLLGLTLYGVRARALVGRDAERDRLWQALREADRGRVRVVCVRGQAGAGKSMLARWLCRRAHELGAAEVLVAEHSPERRGSLAPALRRHLHTDLAELAQACQEAWQALGGTMQDVRALEVAARDEPMRAARRAAVFLRYLLALATRRTVVLWLDDLQWADAAVLALLDRLRHRDGRVLVLATLREEGPTSPRWSKLPTVQLADLAEEDHRRFVHSLLGMAPTLEATVARRTMGQPLFAVHLVSDWVQRGWLGWDAQGRYALLPQARPTIPEEIHSVWLNRLADLGRDHQPLLEVAAVVGPRTSIALWRAAATHLGLTWQPGLLDRIARAGLGTADQTSLHFVHGMLAESLQRLAGEAGRLASCHLAVAKAMEEGDGPPEAIGRHRLAGGDPSGAVPFLVRGCDHSVGSNDWHGTEQLLALAQTGLERSGAPPSDPSWGQLRFHAIMMAHLREGIAVDLEQLGVLAHDAERMGWSEVAADAHWLSAEVDRNEGRHAPAQEALSRALSHCKDLPTHRQKVRLSQAILVLHGGDREGARALFQDVLLGAEPTAHLSQFARIRLAILDSFDGRHGVAQAGVEAVLEEDLEVMTRISALNGLGGIAIRGKDPDRALQRFREALELTIATDAGFAEVMRCNLAQLHLMRGDWRQAEQHLDHIGSEVKSCNVVPQARLMQAWAALLAQEPGRAHRALREAFALADGMNFPGALPADTLETVRQLARGYPEIARTLAALASARDSVN
jgi:eukaryotic-like serine/threonine-protein kinase